MPTQINRRRPTQVAAQEGGSPGANTRLLSTGEAAVADFGLARAHLADEGSYYTVNNPTIDTTVAYGVIATWVTTTVAFLISNSSATRSVTLDYLTIRPTVAPASATNWKFAIEMDNTLRTSTAPTGGVSRTVNNINPAVAQDFEGTVWAFTGGTVLTIMAAGAPRLTHQGPWANSIPVALDEMTLLFGHPGVAGTPATTVGRRVTGTAPCVIPPGCSAAISMYGTSNAITGMSAEYSLGLWQR